MQEIAVFQVRDYTSGISDFLRPEEVPLGCDAINVECG